MLSMSSRSARGISDQGDPLKETAVAHARGLRGHDSVSITSLNSEAVIGKDSARVAMTDQGA